MSSKSRWLTKRRCTNGKHLSTTQKRRQWEFFTLRDRRDKINNLLRIAEATSNHERVAQLNQELEAIEKLGAKILVEQLDFLRVRARRR